MIYRRLDSWLFGSSEAGVGERAAIGDCRQVTLEAINASWPGARRASVGPRSQIRTCCVARASAP